MLLIYPNGVKTLLADGFSICFFKGDLVFSNDPKIVPKNAPDCPILYNDSLLILY